MLLATLSLVLVLISPAFTYGAWKAGVATDVITPEKLMWMSGYGSRTRPAEGKLTELYAKALVLEDPAGQRAVVLSLDLVGIGRELSQRICTSLADRYQLTRAQIAICTSHTHTGPVVGRNLISLHYLLVDNQQQQLIDAYARQLHDKIVALVGKALSDREEVKVSWGSGRADFAVNRRNNPEGDVPQLRAAGKLKGPVDHDVPVLAVHGGDGKLKAVVFGYACHATVLSFYQWSGDYPGFAQAEVEAQHPGCVALFWAGCGADQNPLPRRKVELAQQYGKRLAVAVNEVLQKGLAPLGESLATHYQEVELPLGELPTKEQVQADQQSANRFVAARAGYWAEKLEAGEKLPTVYPYPIQTWHLGSGDSHIQWVFLGGEVVVDYAVAIKSKHRGTRSWVAGYANDVMAYIPSRRVLREGGYEGASSMIYYGLPALWAPELEQLILDTVQRQAESATQ